MTMRKLLLAAILAGLQFSATAQCSVDSTHQTPGFDIAVSDSIPCMTVGQVYDFTLQFHNWDSIDWIPGFDTTAIQLLKFDSFSNMPCGIQWFASSDSILPNGNACIQIGGTPIESPGQYKLTIYASAMVPIVPGFVQQDLGLFGIDLWVRVKDTVGSCAPVDTNAASASSCQFPTSIGSIPNATPLFLIPNPATDQISISGAWAEESLNIVDAFGRIVRRIDAYESGQAIDISMLADGMYYVRVGRSVERFLKLAN